MSEIKGSCHCGVISWEFKLPLKTVVQCHCGMCRKLQGSDYSTWIVVPKTQFKILTGEDKVSVYNANDKSSKSFCSKCGSPVLSVNGKHFPDDYVLPMGAVDNYSDCLAPQIQVYTQDKAQWVKIHEDVPVFGSTH